MTLIINPLPPAEHLTHPKYRPDIDGLRAIAVLSVVIYHAFPKFLRGGFIGVDIFFIISGFLISTIIIGSLERNSFSFIEFYSRRIKRIFPALLLVLITCFVFGWFALLADEYKQLGKHIAGGAGFISNFLFWNESGYFDNAAETKPLLHLWSLGIEEQFYIAWPLLLWFAWNQRFNLLKITIVVAIISFALNVSKVHGDAVAAFYSPQTRFWELLVGSVLAYVTLHRRSILPKIKHKLDMWLGQITYAQTPGNNGKTLQDVQSLLGAFLILTGLLVITRGRHFPGWWAILPTMGALLIISAGVHSWFNRVVLSNRVLVWFGLISFPLYLWHWPLLSFARIMESETPSRKVRIAAVLISIALAWLTYRFVERPIRFGRPNRKNPLILLFLMGLLICIGLDCYRQGGFLNNKISNVPSLNNLSFDWPEEKNKTQLCINQIKSDEIPFCLISANNQPTVALIGDSHANSIFDTVNVEVVKKGGGVIMLGSPSCPPFLNVDRDNKGCHIIMDKILRYISSNSNIKNVIITGRFAATESGTQFYKETEKNFYSLSLKTNKLIKKRNEIFEIGLEGILIALSNTNKNITIVLDVPELDFDPKKCLRNYKECSISLDVVADRQKNYTAIIRKLQRKYKFNIVDLKDVFCDTKVCTAKSNGKILYRDQQHLGINGNSFITDSGFEFLRALKANQQ